MVLARAISLRVVFSRAVFSSLPRLACRRMSNRLASISLTFVAMASAAISRISRAFALAIFVHLANLDPERQLLRGHAEGFHGEITLYAAHFENHPAGQHYGDPAFDVTLAGTHTGFR